MIFLEQLPLSVLVELTFRHVLDQSSQTDLAKAADTSLYYKTEVTKTVDIRPSKAFNTKKTVQYNSATHNDMICLIDESLSVALSHMGNRCMKTIFLQRLGSLI